MCSRERDNQGGVFPVSVGNEQLSDASRRPGHFRLVTVVPVSDVSSLDEHINNREKNG